MRSYLPAFDLRVPATLEEALALMAEPEARWRPFAGGTDLMVLLEAGKLVETKYVSLWSLNALRGIVVLDAEVVINALTTYSDILASEALSREFPLLGQAARETGGIATQNRGTIGGNIANASPAADTPPALLAYDAELDVASARGSAPNPLQHLPHRVQEDGPRAGRADRQRAPAPRAHVDARALSKGRHPPRTGHLEGVLRRCRRRPRGDREGRQARVRERGPGVHPRLVCRGRPARTTAGSGGHRRGASGARPGYRADRRHALDGAVQSDRRGERDGSVPRGKLTAVS